MGVVLLEFEEPIVDAVGVYRARACGRVAEDGRCEGWIEFDSVSGGPTLRTERETTQPNWQDLEYWATGLSAVYLQGALQRARTVVVLVPPEPPQPSTFDRPAERVRVAEPPLGRPVLDPIAVYAQGEAVLRSQLEALDLAHLEVLARVYAPTAFRGVALGAAPERAVLEEAVIAVARASASRPPSPVRPASAE